MITLAAAELQTLSSSAFPPPLANTSIHGPYFLIPTFAGVKEQALGAKARTIALAAVELPPIVFSLSTPLLIPGSIHGLFFQKAASFGEKSATDLSLCVFFPCLQAERSRGCRPAVLLLLVSLLELRFRDEL